jgi:hypothetical protein
MLFTTDDLEELTGVVAATWRSAADRDWSVPAGTLDWSCAKTADHAIDTVHAPAFFLASRRQDDYPPGGWSLGDDVGVDVLVGALETASRLLAAVVTGTDPSARAIIWRRPTVEVRGPVDFVPRGALELILHNHDICAGLAVPYEPPADLCEHLREHTWSWPHWTTPGWSMPARTDDPWNDLLRASGRERVSPR